MAQRWSRLATSKAPASAASPGRASQITPLSVPARHPARRMLRRTANAWALVMSAAHLFGQSAGDPITPGRWGRSMGGSAPLTAALPSRQTPPGEVVAGGRGYERIVTAHDPAASGPRAASAARPTEGQSTMPRRTRSPKASIPQTGVRVAIYTRRSTGEENQPFTIEVQSSKLAAYVASQDGWTIVARYSDDASGATIDRRDLGRARVAARVGQFDVLLVYRVDRFSRRIRDLVQLLDELDTNGVVFRSATEPFDTSCPWGGCSCTCWACSPSSNAT